MAKLSDIGSTKHERLLARVQALAEFMAKDESVDSDEDFTALVNVLCFFAFAAAFDTDIPPSESERFRLCEAIENAINNQLFIIGNERGV